MEFAELISIPKSDGVALRAPHRADVDGTLCITGHHLILSSRKEKTEELWLLHKNVDLIERKDNKPGPNSSSNGGSIVLKCKDLRILQLEFSSTSDLNKVVQTLENLYALTDLKQSYPFFYKPIYSMLEDGYKIFRPEIEYAKLLSGDEWRLTWVNKCYDVCPSYPQAVIVPKNIDDETIVASAIFRKAGRFPVLSYRHDNGAVLLRSSQPLIGPQNKRCKADEKLLNSVLGSNKKGFIFDLRSPTLIAAQKAKGGGMESDTNYPRWRKVNRPMDKISNLQLLDSFAKLMEVCNDKEVSSDKWLVKLDSCGWLGFILNALNTACTIAQCIEHEASPVLVHGTRGMDSTLIICSLVQIILNPDCRTLRGIQALIEREWVQAGHPFSDRHSYSCYYITPTNNNIRKASFSSATPTPYGASPSFLFFLDCVHQLLEQFPCSFEFTQDLLITLFEHSYFSQYGTFIGNSEKEKQEIDLFQKTTSLWSHLNAPEVIEKNISSLYEPNQGIIWPSVAPMSLVLWEELYLRWIIDFTEQRQVLEHISKIREKDKELRIKTIRLRKQLKDLLNEIKDIEEKNMIHRTLNIITVSTHAHDDVQHPINSPGCQK